MGCLWSKCGLPSLSSRSRVIDDPKPENAFSGKTVMDLSHIILAREIQEKKSIRFKQLSPVYEDAALDLRGYDGSDEGKFGKSFDLHDKLKDISTAQLRRMIEKKKVERKGLNSPAKTSAEDTASGSGNAPENGEDCCMDDLLPVLNHDMLWALLSTRPGWDRDLLMKYRDGRTVNYWFMEYQVCIRKTDAQFQIEKYRLPWPDMYSASTDYLISFVKMVNRWAESEVFELRSISNDPPNGVEHDVVSLPRVAATPDRPLPENDMFRDGSSASSGDSVRTTMERNSRKGFVSSMFSNSAAFIDLDPTTGRIRSAAEGLPLRTPAESRRSHENSSSEVSDQAWARPAQIFTTGQCGPGARSAKIPVASEMLEQTGTKSLNMFQNIPKPGLGPPPIIDFSGQKKHESLEELSATGLVQGPPGYGTLLTSDSARLPVAQTRNGFDAAVAQGRRQHIVTFASPYQSPLRVATQKYSKYSGSKYSSFP